MTGIGSNAAVDIGIMPTAPRRNHRIREIAGGVYLEPRAIGRSGIPLRSPRRTLLGDGVCGAMQLYLQPANGRLTGSGASEGDAWRARGATKRAPGGAGRAVSCESDVRGHSGADGCRISAAGRSTGSPSGRGST